MFSTFLSEISGYFDKRFLLSAFFPVLAFAGLSMIMALMLWGPNTLVQMWLDQPELLRVFATVATLGIILFISYLLNIFQTGLTRVYEGYWENIPILSWFGKGRRSFYQKVWDYLQSHSELLLEEISALQNNVPIDETPDQERERKRRINLLQSDLGRFEREWFLSYPPGRPFIMPTKLGNILRASEFYPLKRYGLDAVVAWPRLQGLLPKDFADSLRDAKASLDLLLVVTTLSGIFALGWEIGIGIFTNRWDLFLLASIAWLLMLLGYSGALRAASSYSELVKAAFDLYRTEMLKALHLKVPVGYSEERKLWNEVSLLLYRNYPPDPTILRYDTEPEPKPEPVSKGSVFSKIARRLGLIN